MIQNLKKIGVLLIAIFCGSVGATNSAIAFSTTPINVKVKPGGTVVLRNFYLYRLGPCRTLPPPAVTSSGEKLGKIITQDIKKQIKVNPCDTELEFDAAQVSYQAGASVGTDEFTLFVHNNASFTHIKVIVQVGNSGEQKVQTNKLVKESKANAGQTLQVERKENTRVGTKKIVVTFSSKDDACKAYNDTIQLAGLKNSERVSLANKNWNVKISVEKDKYSLTFEDGKEQLTSMGVLNGNAGQGKWISMSCSGETKIMVLEQ